MRILVTGGAGYIGTELIHQLSNNPGIEEIIIYDNLLRNNYNLFLEGKLPDEKISFIEADILDTRRLKKCLEGVDTVYHLAAHVLTPYSNENPHLFEQVNHWGTAELSYLLEHSNVSRVIYLSSASVYGLHNNETGKYEEPQPVSHYGISKYNGEKMIRRLQEQMDIYIIRSGNVYGYSRSMRFDSVINKFMFYAHHVNRITVNGKGDQKRAFIHIDKLTQFLADLSTTKILCGIYDLVQRNLSVEEIVSSLKQVYPKLEIIYASQNLDLNGMQITKDQDLPLNYIDSNKSFEEELRNIQSGFSF